MLKRFTGTALLTVGLVVGTAGAAAAAGSVTVTKCVGAGGTAVISGGGSTCFNPGGDFDGWEIHGW